MTYFVEAIRGFTLKGTTMLEEWRNFAALAGFMVGEVLQRGTDAEDVVVGADDPERAVLAQQAAALGEPLAGECVIGGEVGEAVPLFVHAVDQAVVRPAQFAAELQVVGWVGEHAMHGGRGKHAHQLHAVSQQDLIQRQFADDFHVSPGKMKVVGTARPRSDQGRAIVAGRPEPRQSLRSWGNPGPRLARYRAVGIGGYAGRECTTLTRVAALCASIRFAAQPRKRARCTFPVGPMPL